MLSHRPLIIDEEQSVAESGEDAFRRIAARKLRERGCPEQEIQSSVQRLLGKRMDLELDGLKS